MSTIHDINDINGFNGHREINENDKRSETEKKGDRARDLYLQAPQTTSSSKKTTIYSYLRGGAKGISLSVSQLFQKHKIACDAPLSPHESLKSVDSTASISTDSTSTPLSSTSYHEIRQAIISCKTTIPLEPQKTVSESLEVFQDKAKRLISPRDTLDSLKESLENPREEKNYPKIKEKIATLEKLGDLEVLAWAENELERTEKETLDTPFSFELDYESLNNGAIEESYDPPKDLIDKAKTSLVKLNNAGLFQGKQDLLEECHFSKEENAKELKRLIGKINSVAKEKDTAFKAVYSKYLKQQRVLLEKKSERLENVISALQEHSLSEPDRALFKTVHEKVKIASNKNWDRFCTAMQTLPPKEKKALIDKINLSSCDRQVKETFKGILVDSLKEGISVNDAISILDLSKELGVQFL